MQEYNQKNEAQLEELRAHEQEIQRLITEGDVAEGAQSIAPTQPAATAQTPVDRLIWLVSNL